MSTVATRMAIDGKWVECLPTDDYGFLGVRYTCELRGPDGRPAKRLLLRRRQLLSQGDSTAQLAVNKASPGQNFGLRPVAGKAYHEVVGADGQQPCKVLQQDVTGLVPMTSAVLWQLNHGDPRRIWTLFYAACKALREFGNAVGSGKLVSLQCPPSLAVTTAGGIVLLDAEIRASGPLPDEYEVRSAYGAWFGAESANGFAEASRASLLHSRAVLSYFLRLLKQSPPPPTPAACAAQAQMVTKLEQAPPDADLDDLEDWVRNNTDDWSLPIEEDSSPLFADKLTPARRQPTSSPAAPAVKVEAAPAPVRKKRSLLLRLSLLLNLFLVVVLVLLWLLWPKLAAWGTLPSEDASASGGERSSLTYSSYCVVFPTQGTISEKVGASLQELFPGKAVEVKRNADERRRMLTEKLNDSVKSLKEPDKLQKLLVDLSSQHAIRFKGFVSSEPLDTLPAVIERGGIFTLAGGGKEQYGSLLQADGVDRVLRDAGIDTQEQPRAQLESLRSAVLEYASLEDALSIINTRTAYLLHVGPTATAHYEVRKKLLNLTDKPVFISRPISELFDAVDPTADSGGGTAAYTLRLDRKCFWRLARAEDRKNVDYAANASNNRMKWQPFDAGQQISWKPIPLTRKSGKTDVVASFDIAVVLESKVVVFRNQSILVGDTKAQVVSQGQKYIDRVLRLPAQPPEDAISVRQQDQQFTGTLVYSFLADQMKAGDADDDFQVFDAADFTAVKAKEDDF